MEDNLFDLVSLYRLGERVRDGVRLETGRSISPNTMQLALKGEPTTALRQIIRRIAADEIARHQAIVAALRKPLLDEHTPTCLGSPIATMGLRELSP